MPTPKPPAAPLPVSARVEWIRSERSRQNLTLDELASAAGVDRSTIFRAEHGKAVSPRKLAKIEQALRGAPGHSSSGLTPRGERQVTPSGDTHLAMGQLIGSMMHSAGGVDPYTTLVEVATECDDPPAVFKQLAELRKKAPPGATFAWWVLRYLDMGGGQRRKMRQ